MSRTHQYYYHDENDIPSFDWYEKDTKVEHSIHIGGSVVLHFAEGRIVGIEIYDCDIPPRIKGEFRDRKGEIEIKTKEEIEDSTANSTGEK